MTTSEDGAGRLLDRLQTGVHHHLADRSHQAATHFVATVSASQQASRPYQHGQQLTSPSLSAQPWSIPTQAPQHFTRGAGSARGPRNAVQQPGRGSEVAHTAFLVGDDAVGHQLAVGWDRRSAGSSLTPPTASFAATDTAGFTHAGGLEPVDPYKVQPGIAGEAEDGEDSFWPAHLFLGHLSVGAPALGATAECSWQLHKLHVCNVQVHKLCPEEKVR